MLSQHVIRYSQHCGNFSGSLQIFVAATLHYNIASKLYLSCVLAGSSLFVSHCIMCGSVMHFVILFFVIETTSLRIQLEFACIYILYCIQGASIILNILRK